jgi:DNA topoisomerase-1
VKELLERSRENRRELSRFVRAELQNQIATLGLATKRDLERMERRITRLEGRSSAAKSTSKKTTAKKTTAKKTTRKPSSTTH